MFCVEENGARTQRNEDHNSAEWKYMNAISPQNIQNKERYGKKHGKKQRIRKASAPSLPPLSGASPRPAMPQGLNKTAAKCRSSTSALFATKCSGSFKVFQCVNYRKLLSYLERSMIKDDGFPRCSIQGSHLDHLVKPFDYKIQKEWQGRSVSLIWFNHSGSKKDCSQFGRRRLCAEL